MVEPQRKKKKARWLGYAIIAYLAVGLIVTSWNSSAFWVIVVIASCFLCYASASDGR